MSGLSTTARVLRRRKNLVSMRFNMINWLLETVSLLLVIKKDDMFLTILYFLLNSCGTPLVIWFKFFFVIFLQSFVLVYFLGIEENRRMAREHFLSRIRIFKRNRVASF